MINMIIFMPQSNSAVAFGQELSGESPTEIYVLVVEAILKNHPELIGQIEICFTTDPARAAKYTGKTYKTEIKGKTVYIKSKFQSEKKWKDLESICQLAGIGFYNLDAIAHPEHKSDTPKTTTTAQSAAPSSSTQTTKPNANTAKEKPKECYANSVFKDDLYFSKTFKQLYHGVRAETKVVDDLGDWKMGQHNTPRGKEAMRSSAISGYSCENMETIADKITARTHHYLNGQHVLFMACEKGGKKYITDTNHQYPSGDVVSMLSAGGMLFVTEISDFFYTGRTDYEFSMGDYGYMGDDYQVYLQLRILDAETGKELLRQDHVDSIISMLLYNVQKFGYQRWRLLDASFNKWVLDRSNGSLQLKKISTIDDILKKNNRTTWDFNKVRDRIEMYTEDSFLLFDKETGTSAWHKIVDVI